MSKRIDIKIHFNCNNHCDFCAQGHKRKFIKPKTLQEIQKILTDAQKNNIEGVVFTGGEPCLHPDIIECIKTASELGFKDIQLQTNARMLSDFNFCKKLKLAGLTEVGPSLHGSKPQIHNKLTHSKSFHQTVAGIINSKKLGLKVITNTVITSLNYKDLPDIAKLLVYLKVDQFQFAFIHIVGTAWENRKWIVPKKTIIMPYVYKALDYGIKSKIPCYTEAIPYCLMKGYENCIAERIIPDGPVADANFYLEDYTKYRKEKGKIKHKKCKKCYYYNICEGPWKEYPEIYGWSEFKPVKLP